MITRSFFVPCFSTQTKGTRMYQIIVALSATFILNGGSQVVTRSLDEPLPSFSNYATRADCQSALLDDANKINASAGPRLTKFVQDNAGDLNADAVRRSKIKARCGRNAADTTDDE